MKSRPTNQSTTQLSRKARHKTAILAGTVLAAATLAAHATTIFSTGFETSQNYHAGTTAGSGHKLVEQTPTGHTWVNQAPYTTPNLDVYTYTGAQVPYTPNASVPVIGGILQLVTPPQNPNGGSQFTGSFNQDGDVVPANFSLISTGLVELSVDYFPGQWFDNSGGNYNGGFHLLSNITSASSFTGGIHTGRGSAQASGDANGNGPWAPQWDLFDSASVSARVSPYRGIRYDGVPGFDNLSKAYWHRIGMVFDAGTGKVTELKVQELIPGGAIYSMLNPVGALSQDLYMKGGANTPLVNVGLRLYNVGTGSLSAYDNVYVGDPYTWTQVPPVPEPSTVGLLLAGLSALGLVRRRK